MEDTAILVANLVSQNESLRHIMSNGSSPSSHLNVANTGVVSRAASNFNFMRSPKNTENLNKYLDRLSPGGG